LCPIHHPGHADVVESQLVRNVFMLAVVAALWTASQVAMRLALVGSSPIELDSVDGLWELVVKIVTTPLLLVGYSLQLANAVLWVVILSRMEISLAAPIMIGIYFAMLMIASALVLGEAVSPIRLAGTALVGVGVWLISRSA
jgi:multidrug transporter EmrE-like cation transporter